MKRLLHSGGAVLASLLAAPVMLAISAIVFVMLMALYACFALRAQLRHQPWSLRDFFYESWR